MIELPFPFVAAFVGVLITVALVYFTQRKSKIDD